MTDHGAGVDDAVDPAELRRHLQEVPPHRALLRSVEARLMSRVPLVHPVLDVGCGDGHFAAMAYRERVDLGTDLPRVALPSGELSEARRRGAYRCVIAARATALPLPDGSVRTVVSNSVLEHIPDLDGALDEISRVLATGGTFAFTSPSEHFAEFLLGSALFGRLHRRAGAAYGRWFDAISQHHHRLDPDAWTAKLTSRRLAVRHWRYYFSERTHRVFDLCHYVGAPTLVARRVTGTWVPSLWRTGWLHRWLRPHATAAAQPAGAYLFFVCEKTRAAVA